MKKALLALSLAVLTLVGCGGGGGGSSAPSGPVTSTLSFSAQSAYAQRAAAGFSDNFTISGDCGGVTCSGNGSISLSTTTLGTVFGTISVQRAIEIVTTSITKNGVTTSGSGLSYVYFNPSNYSPMGFYDPSFSGFPLVGIYSAAPTIPAIVHVGDAGTVGTIVLYNGNTSVVVGSVAVSYVVEADTANTAIINVIEDAKTASNIQLFTTQTRTRITSSGTLTDVSMDMQYSAPYYAPSHLVLTF